MKNTPVGIKRNAGSDLQVLVENGIIEKTGTTGKGTFYFLSGNIGASSANPGMCNFCTN